MPNYKPAVRTGSYPTFSTNSLVFATEAEALSSAEELMNRWFAVEAISTIETDDPVNYRFDFDNYCNVPLA